MKQVGPRTSETDALLPLIVGPQWFIVIALAVALFLFTLKRNFNTWSIYRAYKTVCENDEVRKNYLRLFETRENLLFHIGSAKSHGELDLARRLLRELDTVDKVKFINH